MFKILFSHQYFAFSFVIFSYLRLIVCFLFSCIQIIFPDIKFRSHYPPYGALSQQLDDVYITHINALGLSYLCQILALLVNHSLLKTLVECFYSKMNAFHLPQGEMTITLEDIYRILWIPFYGPQVVYYIVQWIGTEALRAISSRTLSWVKPLHGMSQYIHMDPHTGCHQYLAYLSATS